MSTYFISDTHFSHANIIKYSKRPFKSVEDMDELLIENWNKVVTPDDTIWHLGDFGYASPTNTKNIIRRLNGHKHFVYGNHDKVIRLNEKSLIGVGGFESIQSYAEVTLWNELVVLFHYGMRVWNRGHYGSIHLYGHSHGTLPPQGRSVDVGVDAGFVIPRNKPADYRPVSAAEVFDFMKDRTYEKFDRHGEQRTE